jgi:hypothetical protein
VTKKFGSHEQNDETRLVLSMPVVLLYGQPYCTLPLNNIDQYYIWCFGLHIIDFGVYLQVLARQPDCLAFNKTVNRWFKPVALATRMPVVLLYERPHLIPPSSNFDSYLIWLLLVLLSLSLQATSNFIVPQDCGRHEMNASLVIKAIRYLRSNAIRSGWRKGSATDF